MMFIREKRRTVATIKIIGLINMNKKLRQGLQGRQQLLSLLKAPGISISVGRVLPSYQVIVYPKTCRSNYYNDLMLTHINNIDDNYNTAYCRSSTIHSDSICISYDYILYLSQ